MKQEESKPDEQQANGSGSGGPDIRAFFTNMSAPMPLRKKLYLVFRNNLIKIWKWQNCCGHPGEPGC